MAVYTSEKAKEKTNDKKVVLNVIEECGVVATRSKRKGDEIVRLDYAAWNDGDPKYEIRVWTEREDGEYAAGKGIGLSGEELIALGKLIQALQDDEPKAKPKASACKAKRGASITKKN